MQDVVSYYINFGLFFFFVFFFFSLIVYGKCSKGMVIPICPLDHENRAA